MYLIVVFRHLDNERDISRVQSHGLIYEGLINGAIIKLRTAWPDKRKWGAYIQGFTVSCYMKDLAIVIALPSVSAFPVGLFRMLWPSLCNLGVLCLTYVSISRHKRWRFSLRISLVNVTKFAVSCGFSNIYWRNLYWKTPFFAHCLSSPVLVTFPNCHRLSLNACSFPWMCVRQVNNYLSFLTKSIFLYFSLAYIKKSRFLFLGIASSWKGSKIPCTQLWFTQ